LSMDTLLEVKALKKYFRVRGSLTKKVRAVDGVDFSVRGVKHLELLERVVVGKQL